MAPLPCCRCWQSPRDALCAQRLLRPGPAKAKATRKCAAAGDSGPSGVSPGLHFSAGTAVARGLSSCVWPSPPRSNRPSFGPRSLCLGLGPQCVHPAGKDRQQPVGVPPFQALPICGKGPPPPTSPKPPCAHPATPLSEAPVGTGGPLLTLGMN